MNKTDEAFLLEGDIFAPLIAGLSSDNSAIRSATVQHAFRSMDRAAATGTTYGASIVQSLCDIVVTHSRFREAVINFADISADITNAFFGNADLQGSFHNNTVPKNAKVCDQNFWSSCTKRSCACSET